LAELGLAREIGVHLLEAPRHQLVHRVLLREVGVAEKAMLRLSAQLATAHVDIDEGADAARWSPNATASLI